jgi:N-acetyl-gamma-glutamylphosphate reductase
MKAAVLGATGYTGMLLLRLLSSHKNIDSIAAVSTSAIGKKVEQGDPGLFNNIPGEYISIEELKNFKADVWGSNRCDISWEICGNRIILFSAIDNLLKGASGQAVQNMNIRLGFKETEGLRTWGEL